jgi:hypothetical protein
VVIAQDLNYACSIISRYLNLVPLGAQVRVLPATVFFFAVFKCVGDVGEGWRVGVEGINRMIDMVTWLEETNHINFDRII